MRYKRTFQVYWFCANSAAGCVTSDHVLHLKGGKPPSLPRVWPVDVGTRLSDREIVALSKSGFIFIGNYHGIEPSTPQSAQSIRDGQSYRDPKRRPPRRGGKKVNRRTMTEAGESRREAGLRMSARVSILNISVEHSSIAFQLHTISTTTNKPVNYIITICETPGCTCEFFVNSVSDSKPGHYFTTCKHMYHIYNKVLGLSLTDERPHQATLSTAEVQDMMAMCKSST